MKYYSFSNGTVEQIIRRVISVCLVLALLLSISAVSVTTVYADDHVHEDILAPEAEHDHAHEETEESTSVLLPEIPQLQPNNAALSQEGMVASGTCGANLTWALDDTGTLTIFGAGGMDDYNSESSIPWFDYHTIIKTAVFSDGVTHIGDSAFYYCKNLANIILPDTVNSIGHRAFYACHNLRNVTFPEGLMRIGSYAFGDCYNLESINLPRSLVNVDRYAFDACKLEYTIYDNAQYLGDAENPYLILVAALNTGITSCTIHPDTKAIAGSAFSNCTQLSSITIPDCVTGIGDYAFAYCSKLLDIAIPDSVVQLGAFAFTDCSSLVGVSLGNQITRIEMYTFCNCNHLISVTLPDNVTYIGESAFHGCYNLTDVELPNRTTTIADYAFYNCTDLTSVVIPDSITRIGEFAFSNCSALSSIVLPDGVTSIGKSAFSGCSALGNIVIPDGVTKIESGTFDGCTNLSSIIIPASVTSIGSYAFSGCSASSAIYISDLAAWCSIHFEDRLLQYIKNLYLNGELVTELIIPDGVTKISDYAFSNCNSLTSVTLPDGLTHIGNYAFAYCPNLISISIPDSVTSIGQYAFERSAVTYTTYDNAMYLGNADHPYLALVQATSSSITTCTIHPETKIIADYAFYDRDGLKSIAIPDSVTDIGNGAFSYCSKLNTVTMGSGVIRIGDSAFANCLLKNLTIGSHVKYIGSSAFYSADYLTKLTIPDSVISIGSEAFYYCSYLEKVTMGRGITHIGVDAFGSCIKIGAVYISDLAAWCAIDFENDAANPMIQFQTGLYINGSLVRNLVIPDTVTRISDYAFNGCGYLNKVTIPNSVTEIGEYAFSHSRVISIELPSSITSISTGMFQYCQYLESITIPSSVTSIGDSAFFLCANLTGITIPDTVTYIGESAFGSSGLKSITLSNSITNISESMFSSCSSLTSIAIPNGVTTIGDHAFSGCNSLSSIILPDSVNNIGNHAFVSCGLKAVELGDGVKTIGNYAFSHCRNLPYIAIPDSVIVIGKYAFETCESLTSITVGTGLCHVGNYAFDSARYLWHILYRGAESQWNEITVDTYNYYWGEAQKHYECAGDEIIDPVNKICALCCDHVYGDPVTVPATCTENGYTGYVCTICGYIIKESTIFATGHVFSDWIIDQEPTCDVPGSRHRTCSVCGETETEELIAQHQYGPWIMTGYWTCTEPGSRYHICYLCGYREDDIIPPTGHEYEAVVTPPTCTEQGYTTYTCHCGDYYVADYVPATGHIFIGRDCLNCDAVDENFENPTCGIDPSILYDRMMALQEYFPEGMPWTNDDFYEWNGGIYSGGYGCAAFAFLLSDAAFGTLPSEVIAENITIDQIRVGDILRLYDDTHSVIVLEVYADYVVIAEGNYNSSIHWGRVLTADEIRADADYIMTRYPSHVYTEEIFEPTCTTQGYTMHTCSACGDQYADSYIDALGHDYEGGVCKNCGDTAWPITGTCGDSLTWSLSEDGTLTISGTGDMWDYAWNNAPWINYCTSITALVIEDGVTSIGIYAFHSFSALSSVTIGNDVANIGNMAFWNCTGLTSIALPNSVVYIGDKAFQSCIKLASATLGSSLTAIGDYAFASCSSLTQITFPASVKEIGAYAFDRCNSLVKIAFAGEAPDIGNDAFTGVIATVLYPMCNQTWTAEVQLNYGGSLTWETYNNGHQYGDWLTDAEPTCTEPGSKHRTCSYCGVTETVEMPATGHNYVSGVCQNCGDIIWPISGTCGDNLTWTLTEDGLLTISGTGAMDDFAWSSAPWKQFSESIKQVVIEDGVTSIGNHAFFECSSMTNITIPSGVTSIGSHAFYNCSGLKSITIPSGVTSIGDHAFWNCMSLKNITIPSGIRKIEPYTFWGCTSLTSITIPDGVVSIGNCAFESCNNLISITIPASVKTIDFWAFRGCDHLWHVLYKGTEQQWNAIAIDETNEELLAATRHYNCTGDEITNPKKKICTLCCDHTDFEWIIDQNPSCTAPGSKHRTCSTCGKIETAEIPATGHHYEDGVCQNCGENNWLANGQCGDNLTWVLTEDGILTVSGTGDMWEFGPTGAPWRGYGNSIVTVIIEEGVTGIGSLAFDRCYALTDITMPDSLTYINHFAFQYCYNLTSVVIGSGVTSIGNYAFSECTGLASITIPHGMTDIGAYAFSECFGLVSIVIPESVKSIHLGAFKDCTNLVSVTIPDSVTYIGGQVFQGCSKLWHVLYKGTEEQWSEVLIGEQNDTLTNAIRHYNCTGDEIVDLDNGICVLCCQHSRGEEVDVQATCTEAGYTGYICNICGHTVKETIVPATGHSGTWFTDSSATCTQPGSKHRTCPLCGITETQQIPATGHSFTNYISDGNATTEKDGTKTARCDHGCGATHTVADAGSKLPPAKITSNVYTIKDGYISKIPVGLTAVEFLKGISGIGVRIQKNGTTVTESTKIGTGMVIQLVSNGKVVDSLIIVVTGDTNGDGNISITDMIAVKAHILKKILLTGAAAKAADVNQDNGISITDFIQIKAHILGKSQVKPTAAKEKPVQAQAVPMTLDAPETVSASGESAVIASTIKPMYRITALVKQKERIV